jgi:CTP:molybdopterin cytidylyltransferase MocA
LSDLIHVLIPAAGRSARLGTNKQLVTIDGEPLLRRAVGRILAAGAIHVTIVTGFAAEAVAKVVQGLGCRLVHNADWEEGLGSSLARGVASLPEGAKAALVALPDQLQVPATHFRRLLAQHALTPGNLIASRYGDVVGVPAVFPARLFGEFRALKGQPGAKSLLQKCRAETIAFACPEALVDLDTPADLLALKTRAESRARLGEAPLQ